MSKPHSRTIKWTLLVFYKALSWFTYAPLLITLLLTWSGMPCLPGLSFTLCWPVHLCVWWCMFLGRQIHLLLQSCLLLSSLPVQHVCHNWNMPLFLFYLCWKISLPLWLLFSTLHKSISLLPLFYPLCIYHLHIQLSVLVYSVTLCFCHLYFLQHKFHYDNEQQWCQGNLPVSNNLVFQKVQSSLFRLELLLPHCALLLLPVLSVYWELGNTAMPHTALSSNTIIGLFEVSEG